MKRRFRFNPQDFRPHRKYVDISNDWVGRGELRRFKRGKGLHILLELAFDFGKVRSYADLGRKYGIGGRAVKVWIDRFLAWGYITER